MTKFDTIVVGAGVAGLSAARLLTLHGQSVLLLEARNRIGGRVFSVCERGHMVDHGASWIHGIKDEPTHAITEAFGMRTVEFTVGAHQAFGRPMTNFHADGSKFNAEDTAQWEADCKAFAADLATQIAQAPEATSFKTCVENVLATRTDWSAERKFRMSEYQRHHTEEQYGAWWDDLDAHGLDSDEAWGDEVVFPDGYAVLPAKLSQGLNIRLATEVTEIIWGQSGVQVRTAGNETFSASRVVVTLPVGVLQANTVTFNPPLPAEVAGPLSRMRMNHFEKLFLEFETEFWEPESYVLRQHGEKGSDWHSWYNLTKLHGKPTLLTFPAGPQAAREQAKGQTGLVADALAALREMYGDRVPDPVGVTLTDWQRDPYARGSYAYPVTGSEMSDHDDLATPVGGGVLHIAGEATWSDDPATVPAALLSGHRAAERILGKTVDVLDLGKTIG